MQVKTALEGGWRPACLLSKPVSGAVYNKTRRAQVSSSFNTKSLTVASLFFYKIADQLQCHLVVAAVHSHAASFSASVGMGILVGVLMGMGRLWGL